MTIDEIYIGMRVVATKPFSYLGALKGRSGVVVGTKIGVRGNTIVGVRFDDPFSFGHSCDGLCENGHGRWGSPAEIEPECDTVTTPEEIEISFDSIFGAQEE